MISRDQAIILVLTVLLLLAVIYVAIYVRSTVLG